MIFSALSRFLSRYHDKPVLLCTFGDPDLTIKKAREQLERFEIPTFTSPQIAVRAISALCRYNEYLSQEI